jgi:hypothetical protein
MVRHLLRSLCFAALGAAAILQGFDRSSPVTADRGGLDAAATRVAAADSLGSRSDPLRGRTTPRSFTVANALPEQSQAEDPPPWLVELFHAADPNVRIQALDAWARQPGRSLDPVTYALVDSDESVRARVQDVLERELARR